MDCDNFSDSTLSLQQMECFTECHALAWQTHPISFGADKKAEKKMEHAPVYAYSPRYASVRTDGVHSGVIFCTLVDCD